VHRLLRLKSLAKLRLEVFLFMCFSVVKLHCNKLIITNDKNTIALLRKERRSNSRSGVRCNYYVAQLSSIEPEYFVPSSSSALSERGDFTWKRTDTFWNPIKFAGMHQIILQDINWRTVIYSCEAFTKTTHWLILSSNGCNLKFSPLVCGSLHLFKRKGFAVRRIQAKIPNNHLR